MLPSTFQFFLLHFILITFGQKMADRIERLVVLPFSLGCVSQASVDVMEERSRRSKLDFKLQSSGNDEDADEESLKHSSRFLKPNLSTGVNKLVRGFKSLSQLFTYEDEMEELGMEMEIGSPTDVKHVAHIGWDGTTATNLTGEDNSVVFRSPVPPPPFSSAQLK